MKLRIQDNSIRLRLTRGEAAKLGAGERVEGTIRFALAPSAALTYAVETSPLCNQVQATGSDREIRVTLPADLARTWANTDQVSIEDRQPIGPDAFLSILVEKDFRCLHTPSAEQGTDSDNFPNPADVAAR